MRRTLNTTIYRSMNKKSDEHYTRPEGATLQVSVRGQDRGALQLDAQYAYEKRSFAWDDSEDKHRDWQHSTFVQRSYKRVHQLYREIVKHIKEAQHE